MSAWSGRRATELTAACLTMKGRLCHLCELAGANSADHDPPRQDLIERGVPDPDDLAYLFPAHLKCNQRRARRPVTAELRAELRARRLADLEAMSRLSTSLEGRRPAHRRGNPPLADTPPPTRRPPTHCEGVNI